MDERDGNRAFADRRHASGRRRRWTAGRAYAYGRRDV